LTIIVGVDLEDPIQCPYCGPKNMKPLIAYTPFINLNDRDFFFVKLHDLSLFPNQMGKMQGDVVKDEENTFLKMVRVQWWVLMKKGRNLDE
jgi:hypothetical protein